MSEPSIVAGHQVLLGEPYKITFRNTFALLPSQWLEAGEDVAQAPTPEHETFVAFIADADAEWVYTANQRGADGRFNVSAAISVAAITGLVRLGEVGSE